MKKLFIAAGIISSTVLFVSCGETEKTEEKKEAPLDTAIETKPCLLTLDNENVVVNWTAFKLSEKVGVGGTFDSVVVSGVNDNETILGAAVNAQFDIYTASVNSNNPERDMKISNSFFGTMANTESISGKVVSLNDGGSGAILLTMNGVEKEIALEWKATSENRLKLSTAINVNDWNAKPSLDSLNGVCTAVHTGKDGVSVLWPDVEIEVFADFKSDCE
ncbi:YceI family protein [Flavobacteriales bacterium]|jgi:polyisoprenoid-binding protein YceI|nr:YceI family protein [Flavobacteriales bacterium]